MLGYKGAIQGLWRGSSTGTLKGLFGETPLRVDREVLIGGLSLLSINILGSGCRIIGECLGVPRSC